MGISYCIIADDFTGAGDSAIQFRKNGYSAFLPLKGWGPGVSPGEYDVLVLSTETRFMSPEASQAVVRQFVAKCGEQGIARLYKKIDSTLRGHVAKEIAAVLESTDYECAIVAPAVPENGRTVLGGHCLVQGVAITTGDHSRDVFNPVEDSSIPALLEPDFPGMTGSIEIADLRQGKEFFLERLTALRGKGYRVIVVDSETMEDLAVVASVQDDPSILFVGASGLAEALSLSHKKPLLNTEIKALEIAPGRQMYVVGSITKVSREQLAVMEAAVPAGLITLDIRNMLADEAGELANVIKQIGAFSEDLPVVVKTSESEAALQEDIAWAVGEGVKEIELGELISGFLGRLTVEVFRERPIEMLFLTGGNTAARIVEALGSDGIEFLDEILPGIPLGKFKIPGDRKEASIVTKAGGFGKPDSLVKIYNFFTRES